MGTGKHQVRRRRAWIGTAVGLAALGGTSVAVGQAISGPAIPAERQIAQARAVDSALSSQAAAFRLPRRAGDSLPAWAAAAVSTRVGPMAGANLALSRSAQLGAAGTMYIVPGNGQICGISEGAGACGPVSALATEGLNGMNHLATDPPHTMRFTGIVPDEVTAVTFIFAAGPSQRAALANNAYGAILTRAPLAIAYVTRSGTKTRPLDQELLKMLLSGPPAGLASSRPG